MSVPANQHFSSCFAAGTAAAIFLFLGLERGAVTAEVVDEEQIAQISEWFSAWELVSIDVYGIEHLQPVDFIFFDSTFVYTTSDITGVDGIVFDGPQLLGQQLLWRSAEHDGSLRLPDGSTVPLGLMSFAAPVDKISSRAFFVMPLPEYWDAAGVTSDELGLDNLLTGVFLHEFSHSQQMHNFGAKLTEFEQKYRLGDSLTDDIVQETFEHDSQYTKGFRDEVQLFYEAAHSDSVADLLALTRLAMTRYRDRQQRSFVNDLAMLRELDDFFLSMEGFGQFTMYAWLIHPGGGAFGKDVAEAGVRRGGRWWSQEQGLSLFLLLQRFSDPKDWAERMFGEEYGLAADLIEAELATN